MSDLFLKILNMSISASWLVLAVVVLRLLLKKAPKWVSVLLWGIVAVRLICPFSFESVLSLIPSAETVSPEIMMDPTPQISTGIESLNNAVNPIISQSFAPEPSASANPLQILIPVAAIVWLAGIAVMLIHTAVSYWLLRRKVATAIRLQGNLFQSEHVDSPFVLGIISPRIYLPFRLNGQSLEHVLAHEQAHIRRKDHWWKPLGFLLLSIHWFNPLMWLAYILLCRDIELACDEKVIQKMDNERKADYTQALVACSVNRRSIAACPLAFGEVGVKERAKAVMKYKKPGFWLVIAAVIICIAVAVCFLTNPAEPDVFDILEQHHYTLDRTHYITMFDDYTILASQQVPVTLRVSKADLPDSIYTSEGHDFKEGEVIAYRSDDSTIYLHNVMLSNESDERLYFTFDFSYDFGDFGSFLSLYHPIVSGEEYLNTGLLLQSKALKDDSQVYPDALAVRGFGDGTKFSFYVSKEACMSAEGELLIDIVCPQVFYAKEGYESEAEKAYADEFHFNNAAFTANILEIRDGYFLVEPSVGTSQRSSAKTFIIPIQNIPPSPEPVASDLLYIEYDDSYTVEEDQGHLRQVKGLHVIRLPEWPELPPMVIADGILYLDTGREGTTQGHSGIWSYWTDAIVDPDLFPYVSETVSIGALSYHAGPQAGTIEVNVDGKWKLFATEEVFSLQFPSEA